MSEYRIASRYAKSLIDLSKEKQMLEEVNRDMKLLSDTFDQNPELHWTMKSPVVKSAKKGSILKTLFENKVSKLSSLFISTVSKKERESFLPAISEEFIKQYNAINGIADVEVLSATELSNESKTLVKEFVEKETGNKALIHYTIDTSVIGGVVIRMDDQLYDFSISKQLKQLKKELAGN